MEISSRWVDEILILDISGRIGFDYEEVKDNLLLHIKDQKNIIINCQNLNYITSMGLRAFLYIMQRIPDDESKLVFCSLTKSIKDIFAITGFLHLFLIFNSEDEALDYIKS